MACFANGDMLTLHCTKQRGHLGFEEWAGQLDLAISVIVCSENILQDVKFKLE
jgi:hypothetical protein